VNYNSTRSLIKPQLQVRLSTKSTNRLASAAVRWTKYVVKVEDPRVAAVGRSNALCTGAGAVVTGQTIASSACRLLIPCWLRVRFGY
jgi:hypothetical protein